MSMPDHFTSSLQALAGLSLEHAIGIATDSRGPFAPFAFIDAGDEQPLPVSARSGPMADLPVEQQLDALRAAVKKAGSTPGVSVNAAVVVYDGFLTLDGEKTDAVLVEAYEAGQPAGVVFAQAYRSKTRSRRGESIGDAQLIQVDVAPMF